MCARQSVKSEIDADVVESILYVAPNIGVVLQLKKARNHEFEIQLFVNSCNVSQAGGRESTNAALIVSEVCEALSLNPLPIRIVVRGAEQSVHDVVWVWTSQQ